MRYTTLTPEPAMTNSSLRANCNSGEPIRYDFIWMEPSMEKVRTYGKGMGKHMGRFERQSPLLCTWPFELKVADILSITSTKISFLPERELEFGREIG